MACNKITFVFVLVGLISISCMVSSAAVGKDEPTTSKTDAPTTTKTDAPTTSGKDVPTTSGKDEPTTSGKDVTTQSGPTGPTTGPTGTTNGAGYPKITYGMLFSFISAILLLSA